MVFTDKLNLPSNQSFPACTLPKPRWAAPDKTTPGALRQIPKGHGSAIDTPSKDDARELGCASA